MLLYLSVQPAMCQVNVDFLYLPVVHISGNPLPPSWHISDDILHKPAGNTHPHPSLSLIHIFKLLYHVWGGGVVYGLQGNIVYKEYNRASYRNWSMYVPSAAYIFIISFLNNFHIFGSVNALHTVRKGGTFDKTFGQLWLGMHPIPFKFKMANRLTPHTLFCHCT